MRILNPVRWFARQGFLIILTAAIILEATAVIQFYYAQKGLREEATRRAESELEATGLEIDDVMDQVESAVRNNIWLAQTLLAYPDTLRHLPEILVANNPVIYGSTIALEPDYYPGRERLFSPYAYREGDAVRMKQLGSDAYDYTAMEWYADASETGHWSEPYFDTGGGEAMMTTFSMPVTDPSGRRVGVITADMSLEWLTDLVGDLKVYPGAISMMFSRTGQVMVCPAESLVMRRNIAELTASMEDTAAIRLGREMLAGKSGNMPIRAQEKVRDVFYAPVERTGWSMAIVIPREEIFRGVKRIGMIVGCLQLLGLLMLALILYRTAAGRKKLQAAEERKERMDRELQIASGIQMAMLPKVYPPFPERNELDVFGLLVPAKEVGGDLFDYYLRGDSLLFCIGDVSGKGIPASLVMAVTRSLFRSVSAHDEIPGRIAGFMNESMAEMNDSSMFVTLFLGILDLSTGRLRYCNAGHNAPLTVTADGQARFLSVLPNLPLGVDDHYFFVDEECQLAPGDTLFLYTDGLTEAENAGKELFGEERLLGSFASLAPLGAHAQVTHIVDAVHEHVGTAPQSDDLTMLSIKYQGVGEGPARGRWLRLHNDIRQLSQLAGFVESVGEDASLGQTDVLQLNLAVEEAVTNVIMYAYPGGTDGLVDIEAVVRDGWLVFTISDSGKPFDPTAARPVDTSLSAEQRPIGGLGIHLVRQIMDEVSYARVEDRNILTLKKKV